jgi:hypothetical protein
MSSRVYRSWGSVPMLSDGDGTLRTLTLGGSS